MPGQEVSMSRKGAGLCSELGKPVGALARLGPNAPSGGRAENWPWRAEVLKAAWPPGRVGMSLGFSWRRGDTWAPEVPSTEPGRVGKGAVCGGLWLVEL